MGRHSSADHDDVAASEVAAAQLAYEESLATGEIQAESTGRHNFAALSDVPLGPDPLAVHQAMADAPTGGATIALVAPQVVRDAEPFTLAPPDVVPDDETITLVPPDGWQGRESFMLLPPDGWQDREPTTLAPPDSPDDLLRLSAGKSATGVAREETVEADGTDDDRTASGVIVLDEPLAQAPPTVPALTESAQTDEIPPGLLPPSKRRAGRNLPAAIGVGLGMGVVIVLTLFLYRPSFLAVIIIAVAYGSYELRTAIATVEARPPLVPVAIGGIAIAVVSWNSGTNGLVIAALLTAVAIAIWRLGEGAAGYLRDVASAMFVLLYLPVLAGFAVLLAVPSDGAARVLVFAGTVVCSDTGGYAVGVLFGKHPLAPGISKGKTWEGAAGSLVACVIAGVLFLTLVFHQPWWTGLVFGVAMMIAATLGDLGESMLKRDLGVKDMGRLLPGHGGLMDRLDSMLPCAAVAYLLLSYFA